METKKCNKIKQKSKQLVLQSTSHGLPNAFRSNRLVFKIMWISIFITSTLFGSYTVIKTIKAYLDYEIVTNIDVITEIPTDFPAISLINLRNQKLKKPLNEIMIYCNFNLEECNHTADPGYYSGGTKSGFILAPGFNHEIVIRRTFTSKLGHPFNNCIKNVTSLDSYDSDLYKYILTNTNYHYTQKDCFDYCMGTELNKHFNITNKTDHWLNLYKTFAFNQFDKKIQFETYSFDKFWDFYSGFIKDEIQNVCTPLCPLECDSIKYDTSISFTKFSNNEFEFLFDLNGSIDNLIWIDIYYGNLEYTSITQLPKMNPFDLISNIGSNLMLFIGISFISFAEIIEILGEIVIILFEKRQKRHQFMKNVLKKRYSI